MRLGRHGPGVTVEHPIVQAPMAGVSTPELAAIVSNAGGLGSIGIGASSIDAARQAIRATRALTARPFNVNLFVHDERAVTTEQEAGWAAHLAGQFGAQGGTPPLRLSRIYRSQRTDPDLVDMLAQERPGVVSFHFGRPDDEAIRRLRAAGAVLLATATSRNEAAILAQAGIDAIVAQGFEAGGHRGIFDENGPDERLGTLELTTMLVSDPGIPVIAAGGLMDGQAVARVLDLGAIGAQLGTAFVSAPESAASAHYRDRLLGAGEGETVMTRTISGRPARGLRTLFTEALAPFEVQAPAYPFAYDAYKQLAALAGSNGDPRYSALWAGMETGRSRGLPAAELMARLVAELRQARADSGFAR